MICAISLRRRGGYQPPGRTGKRKPKAPANSQLVQIRCTILFFPQRGRMSAKLTGEGEKSGSSAIVSASPSSVIRLAGIGGCHLPPLGEGFGGRLIAVPTMGPGTSSAALLSSLFTLHSSLSPLPAVLGTAFFFSLKPFGPFKRYTGRMANSSPVAAGPSACYTGATTRFRERSLP